MNTTRNTMAALAVVAAVALPATGAVAAESRPPTRADSRSGASPAARPDALATAPTSQVRVSIVDLVDSFLFCDEARSATMYPPSQFFVLDCMRGAPASNG